MGGDWRVRGRWQHAAAGQLGGTVRSAVLQADAFEWFGGAVGSFMPVAVRRNERHDALLQCCMALRGTSKSVLLPPVRGDFAIHGSFCDGAVS